MVPAGVADSARAPADKDDGMVAGKLEPFQNHERDQVADMHAVSCRIDTAVQGDGFCPPVCIVLPRLSVD